MKKVAFALLALVALAFCAVPGMAFAGEASADIGGVVRNIASAIFNNVDTAIILLGVASFALNQISQIWAWSADSRMGKIERLIEDAISGAYLLKGQPLKKQSGKLTLEQGKEVADAALEKLKGYAEEAGINLDSALGDDSQKRSRIQTIFDRMRNRAKPEGRTPDAPENAAVAE